MSNSKSDALNPLKSSADLRYVKFELAIQDFGCGIPAEMLPHLFIDFSSFQPEQNTNPYGRGLGLSICKLIVEKMGGELKVHSKPHQGTTFTMHLSMMYKNADESSIVLNNNEPPPVVFEPDMISEPDKPNVLLANDDNFLLMAY